MLATAVVWLPLSIARFDLFRLLSSVYVDILLISNLPTAWRLARLPVGAARIEVDADRCTIWHPALLSDGVVIRPSDLRSIVPLWLRPESSPTDSVRTRLDLAVGMPTIPSSHRVPMLGTPRHPRRDVLLFVLRDERLLPQARARWLVPTRRLPTERHPVAGLLVAVDDLTEAQRPFATWGVLARLTADDERWLRGRRRATSWSAPVP